MGENNDNIESKWMILQKYSQLLNESEEARNILCQDETLPPFLLDTLSGREEDQRLTRTALEILLELTSGVGSKAKSALRINPKCKAILESVLTRFISDANIVFICESILDQLFPGRRAVSNQSSNNTGSTTRLTRASRFLAGSARKQLKTLIFQATAFLDIDVKHAVEQSLVKVKGVVSIYFELGSMVSRCIIRVNTTVLPQAIADAILATGRVPSVQQISKNEFGEETTIVYETTDEKESAPVKSACPLPAYLDDLDDVQFNMVIGDRALAKCGDNENGGKNSGWLSGVATFFSKTLYW